jgi:hypothetical protein
MNSSTTTHIGVLPSALLYNQPPPRFGTTNSAESCLAASRRLRSSAFKLIFLIWFCESGLNIGLSTSHIVSFDGRTPSRKYALICFDVQSEGWEGEQCYTPSVSLSDSRARGVLRTPGLFCVRTTASLNPLDIFFALQNSG